VIISADEPQLERCLASVHKQFDLVVHVNNVSPECDAFNQAVEQVQTKWMAKIDGDFILYDNAREVIEGNMHKRNSNIYTYTFGLFDAFFRSPILGCAVSRADLLRKFKYADVLHNDRVTGRAIEADGWSRRVPGKRGIIIGTHCDDPDLFQVFRRCYTLGCKYAKRYFWTDLHRLWKETGDPRYELGIRAMEYGATRRHYPTSHNINFDRTVYEEFRRRYYS
jgi:hypothetical protein